MVRAGKEALSPGTNLLADGYGLVMAEDCKERKGRLFPSVLIHIRCIKDRNAGRLLL
jgi:hypothetical protein